MAVADAESGVTNANTEPPVGCFEFDWGVCERSVLGMGVAGFQQNAWRRHGALATPAQLSIVRADHVETNDVHLDIGV